MVAEIDHFLTLGECPASVTEEPGAGKPPAGICAGGTRQRVSLPRYSPELGRWVNRDPIGELDGPSVYSVVGNSPIGSIDLYGLSKWKKKGMSNCCGYAMTGLTDVHIVPPSNMSIYDFLANDGWQNIRRIEKADDCVCECNEYKFIMVVYKLGIPHANTVKRYQNRTPPRAKDDIFGRKVDWDLPQHDFHCMRSEWGCDDKFTCVPHQYARHQMPPSVLPVNPKKWVGRRMISPNPKDNLVSPALCACKPRKDAEDFDEEFEKQCPCSK